MMIQVITGILTKYVEYERGGGSSAWVSQGRLVEYVGRMANARGRGSRGPGKAGLESLGMALNAMFWSPWYR